MKIVVFGATGMVGKQVVMQALNKGFHVRAFGRNVEGLIDEDLRKENFEAIRGYVFDETDVLKAIKGCDAVVSVLGGDSSGADKTRSLGMKNIVAQMQKANVQRIVALGGIGILQADETTKVMEIENFPKEFLPVSEEHLQAFEMLSKTSLQWTFICPPNINNEGPTGHFNTSEDYPPLQNKFNINAGDIALCMLQALEENRFVNKRVGISSL
jgi:uncharacterized protein